MMPSLTNIARLTRKAIVILLISFVSLTVLYLILSYLVKTINSLKPATPPTVSTTFGKVPRVVFPEQTFPTDLKFTIETVSGDLPVASPTAKIYFITKKQQGLLNNIKAVEDAKKIGFVDEEQSVDKKLVFKAENKEFTIDPISRDFTYQYDYVKDGSVFLGENKLVKNTALSRASSFLNAISALPEDYNITNPTITLLTFNGANFIATGGGKDDENATAARIDYFRKDENGIIFVTPSYNKGNIYTIVSKSQDEEKQILKAERNYQEISYENFGIYPLKTINEAWNELTSGEGYIADSGNSTFTKRAIIRNAFLAYYDDSEKQDYILPIFVFTGDDGFVGYTNAISEEWLE